MGGGQSAGTSEAEVKAFSCVQAEQVVVQQALCGLQKSRCELEEIILPERFQPTFLELQLLPKRSFGYAATLDVMNEEL
ncbi:MAG: hypothetical protein ACJA2W_000199 [Planctomycetota bacterium]|jgi:hypothetical protein